MYFSFYMECLKSTILRGQALLRARKHITQNQTYRHLMSDFGGFVIEFDLTPYYFDNLTLLLQHLTLLFFRIILF